MPAWVYRLFGFEMALGRELDLGCHAVGAFGPFQTALHRPGAIDHHHHGQEMIVTHDLV